jgi:hypothetical protein
MILPTEDRAAPVAVNIRDEMLWVTLQDGRVVGTPLNWYPFLEGIPDQYLSNIELKWNAIWWPDLDEGLSIDGMLEGVNPREEMMTPVETT